MSEKAIEHVLSEHSDSLMALAGVVGTGLGMREGAPCIVVFVEYNRSIELISQIPSDIEGYPVQVRESGAFRALS